MAKSKKSLQEQWIENVAKKASLDINSIVEGMILKERRKKKLGKLLGKDDEEKG